MERSKPEYYILGETYIKFKFDYSEKNISLITNALKDDTKFSFKSNLQNKEIIKISVEFDKGSIKTKVVVWGTALYLGIGAYGDFRGGVDQIISDSKEFSEFVSNKLINNNQIEEDDILRLEKRTGITGRLKEIYNDIERMERNLNNMSPNEMNAELQRIRVKIANINSILSPVDQNEFINSLPNQYSDNLPNPNERKTNYYMNRYGLKPEDEFEELNYIE